MYAQNRSRKKERMHQEAWVEQSHPCDCEAFEAFCSGGVKSQAGQHLLYLFNGVHHEINDIFHPQRRHYINALS